MYVIRKKIDNSVAFMGCNGWITPDPALELDDVLRFTKGEMESNTLPEGEEWVWYGSYKELT